MHMIGALCAATLAGDFSDRFGRKKLILLGLCFTCCGELIGAFSNSIYIYLMGRFITGIGFGGLGPFVLGKFILHKYFANFSTSDSSKFIIIFTQSWNLFHWNIAVSVEMLFSALLP